MEKNYFSSSATVEDGRLPRKPRSCLYKCLIGTATVVTALMLLLFVLIFVGVPLAFKYSVRIQRLFIFMPIDTSPEQFEYLHNHTNGTRNLYVTLESPDNVTLGLLHLLPLPLINQSIENENFSFPDALAMPDYPVLLHFHGNGGNRFYNLEIYLKLRQYFHVIGFDYQSYGDSTKVELTELGIVEVSVELYKWLVVQTSPDNIYVWGHSLGGAIAAHTLARLKYLNMVPRGLILEATFPSLRDEVENYRLAKAFTWLPWFESTILDGLERNGFIFNTSRHISSVDCPIMILHAEDDGLIPYTLAEKLNSTVSSNRNRSQGNVTFHGIPSVYECSHWSIMQWPMFCNSIEDYMQDCQEYYNKTKNSSSELTDYNISTISYTSSAMPPITSIRPYNTTIYNTNSLDLKNIVKYLL